MGIRDAITARDTNVGDGHALDAARKRSVEAILRRRTIGLTTHALPATATKALAFRAVLDPTCPGEPLPWLRHAATSRAARLRVLLRADPAPLVVELWRYVGVAHDQRRCPFCTSGAVEDAAHSLPHCTAWATQRADMLTALTDKLAAVMATTGPGVPAVFGDQWFASRPAPDRARYLLGAHVPGLLPHDSTPGVPIWTEEQAREIMAGISEVFVEYGWRMWQARGKPASTPTLALPASPLRGATVHPPHPLHRRPRPLDLPVHDQLVLILYIEGSL